MPLIEDFERTGSWLFRWRSYLPFVFLPLIVIAVLRYPAIESNPNLHFAWSIFSLSVSLVGLFVRCHTVGHAAEGTSGRNTHTQLAESLNTSGFYSVVRHPLYLGNFLIALGIVLLSASPWLIVFYAMAFTLYYERIMFVEEIFLRRKFGRKFMEWANRTPAFVPKLRQWRSAEQPIDFPKVIRAESVAVAVIALTFPTLEFAMHYAQEGNVEIETSWYVLLASGILTYIVARVMKRQLRRWLKYERILYEAAK
ncbi:methyltransferase family protein [Roseiconus lacunae]|uniref:Isoprenylcysteine carboxylmethyltransferase family protein n=1 Tax=Roseiconus lacunae TaxID=2605694 RepID=A0ABT7PF39_9BACT|nr:isoprenylcysteine carboxylmethyltransferase family protein [Roseiconus lacunae]MDM4015108.1 isoprenylcysteine carboxylmethyltransferase family protein [Roseiconus lacunae]